METNDKPLWASDPVRAFFQVYRGPFSPHWQALRHFRPKVRLNIERGNYLVKTADTAQELEDVLKLRWEVFHREHLQRKLPFGSDLDRRDLLADHLIILDQRTKAVVGTYRLICSDFSTSFYSESEFDLSQFLALPGTKLELSRACIARSHRTGIVMSLLWRGVAKYLAEVNARYLFGCASVWTMDKPKTLEISRWVQTRGHALESVRVSPIGDYRFPQLEESEILGQAPQSVNPPHDLPSLFQSYLKMGAKVGALPALDREFKCVDYFTVLDWSELTKSYEKKYQPC